MPSFSSTKAPNDVILVTVPFTTSPILKKASMSRPRIGRELLHAKADALLVRIDVEHDRVHFVALLQDFGGWLTLRVQLMSETCTMPSMPSSSSMNAP